MTHRIFRHGTWSVVVACGPGCSVACWILVPWPGIEPTFPALQGEFLTTGPSGKPQSLYFVFWHIYLNFIDLSRSTRVLDSLDQTVKTWLVLKPSGKLDFSVNSSSFCSKAIRACLAGASHLMCHCHKWLSKHVNDVGYLPSYHYPRPSKLGPVH